MKKRSDKNNPGRATNTTGTDTDELRYRMSFNHCNTKRHRMQERFCRVVDFAVRFYILIAGLWAICYLVSEILEKMGVG